MRAYVTIAAICILCGCAGAGENDGCESWTFHGYRVGMENGQARPLRSMQERDGFWHVKEQGKFMGTLQFRDGGLETYSASLGGIIVKDDWPVDAVVDVEAVRRKIEQRLGPADKVLQVESPDPQGGLMDVRADVWLGEDCDAMLVLEQRFKDRGEGPVRFAVNVLLRRLSTLPEAERQLIE